MEYLITTLFGLVIGSFLNVCIYRIAENYRQSEKDPKSGKKQEKLSISSPSRSICPHCKHQLSALDNIPVLSYIFLRGKCRYCGKPISPRYIIVEILTASIFVLILHKGLSQFVSIREITIYMLRFCFFASFLIVITFIDLQEQVIPDKVVYPGIIIGLLLSVYISISSKSHSFMQIEIIKSLMGGIIGAGIIFLIAFVGSIIARKEVMGMGDVPLMGMIGVYLGFYPNIPITLILASLSGAIIGIIWKKAMRGVIPFGPFLSLGAMLSLLYGKEIWLWYKGLMGLI